MAISSGMNATHYDVPVERFRSLQRDVFQLRPRMHGAIFFNGATPRLLSTACVVVERHQLAMLSDCGRCQSETTLLVVGQVQVIASSSISNDLQAMITSASLLLVHLDLDLDKLVRGQEVRRELCMTLQKIRDKSASLALLGPLPPSGGDDGPSRLVAAQLKGAYPVGTWAGPP
uniref:(northern house mosquito) hypothetical protein n=1 Tax=Culex pipiens TaxID=7175 RepID=A0A8D8G1G0_CULPI